MKSFIYILAILFLLNACASKKPTVKTSSNKTISHGEKIDINTVKFVSKSLSGDAPDVPITQVNVQLNEMLIPIDTVEVSSTLGTDEYQNYAIPSEALSASGGWWAGSGNYYYIIQKDESFIVMKGFQEEKQSDTGFHYTEFKRFSIYRE